MNETFLGLAYEDWRSVALSVRIALMAVAISLPPGMAVAWLLATRTFRGKTLVELLVNLPLVLPPVVTGLLLLYLLGRRGWAGQWLYQWFGWEIALTWKAAVVAVAVMGFPLLVRSMRLAFEASDPRLYQAARSLGAGPLDAFFTVSLPLAWAGVVGGCLLSFARGLGEFGATLMFAGIRDETRTMAIQIYTLYNQPSDANDERMWRVVLASLAVAVVALAASEYLTARGRRHESV